jgi:transcriptional regulator with XRE-family HTH domain
MSIIGSNIKKFRSRLGLTQKGLADLVGINRSNIGSYEEGRAEPGFDNLKKLSSFFCVTVEELLTENYQLTISSAKTKKDQVYEKYARLPIEKRKIVDFILEH